MNILILGTLEGGVGSHIRNLEHILVEHNYNPHVIALSHDHEVMDEERYTLINAKDHLLLDLFHLGEAAYNYILNYPVDLVHAHFITPPGYCAMQLNQYMGIPYVITLHGDDIHYWCKPFSFREQSATILSSSSKVITVSNSLANEVKETLNIDSKKLTVISNIVDMVDFNPNIKGSTIRDKYKICDPIILYVGRLWPHKGLHILLLAFKKLLEEHVKAKLMIVGDGFIRNELLNIARHLKIDDNIVFTGRVSRREIPLYMAACDVFTLPSIFEGQGMAALEAMSCAKPVVATTTGSLSEIVENDENGFLVKPYDVNGLSKALKRLIENEDLRKELGLKGRKNILDKFNSHDIAIKILITYTEALMTDYMVLHQSV